MTKKGSPRAVLNAMASDIGPTTNIVSPSSSYGAISSSGNENESGEASNVSVKLFRRRWYILSAYVVMTIVNAITWNTFAPISQSFKQAFCLLNSDVALMENWNNITFVIFIGPLVYIIERYGLRPAMLISAVSMFLGSVVRSPLYWPHLYRLQLNVGQFLIGVSGPVSLFACTTVSATWFAHTERSLATSLMSMAQSLGVALSFILGPKWVDIYLANSPSDENHCNNASIGNTTTRTPFHPVVNKAGVSSLFQSVENATGHVHSNETVCNMSASGVSVTADGVRSLLYFEAGLSLLSVLLIVAYFPSRPPAPPSNSASTDRTSVKASILALVKDVDTWMITAAYGISQGMYSGWFSVLSLALLPGVTNIKETTAGWIGFAMTLCGIAGGFAIGVVMGYIPKHYKSVLLAMMAASAVVTLVLSMSVQSIVLKMEPWVVWTTSLALGTILTASSPVFFECACEHVYPVPESMVTGWVTLTNNIVTVFYLLPLSFHLQGNAWLNWAMFASLVICLPFTAIMRPRTNRLDVDDASNLLVNDAGDTDGDIIDSDNDGIRDQNSLCYI